MHTHAHTHAHLAAVNALDDFALLDTTVLVRNTHDSHLLIPRVTPHLDTKDLRSVIISFESCQHPHLPYTCTHAHYIYIHTLMPGDMRCDEDACFKTLLLELEGPALYVSRLSPPGMSML